MFLLINRPSTKIRLLSLSLVALQVSAAVRQRTARRAITSMA